MRLQKKILNKLHVVIGPLVKRYLSKPRVYRKRGATVLVLPSVFHPGLFFSTGLLTDYMRTLDVKGKKILELGAGSGFLSIVCAKMGAHVTKRRHQRHINRGLVHNAALNHFDLEIVHSDLFGNLGGRSFDLVVINPPYYRKAVTGAFDYAWYCGENFEYFKKLFRQLGDLLHAMIKPG